MQTWPLAVAALLLSVAPSFGQPLTNPRIVEFFPSPDHNVTLASGSPAVTKYVLEVYQAGATAPFHSVDMGKPAPQADGVIRYDFSSGVGGWPLPGGIYESRVAAVGPNGTGRSELTNQFTFGTCSYTLSPTSGSFTAAGGTGSFNVTTQSGCSWTTSSSASWVTVASGSGTGSGTVRFTVSAYTGTIARTAQLTVAGYVFSVQQSGAILPAAPSNLRIIR